MRTVQEKLDSLNKNSVWYFAKQDTNFDNAFRAVEIFDQIPDRQNTNIEEYYATNAGRFNYHSNHRALSVAQMYGLLSKTNPFERGSRYNTEVPTPVYYILKNHPIGSREYNAIKTEQLLKLRMSAITDSRTEAGLYKLNPVLFSFEVLWKLHLRGIDSITLPQFYTYVMTCQTHDEVEEAVELLSQNPEPSTFVDTYKANSRVVTILQGNFNLLTFSQDKVSVTPAFVDYFKYFFNGPYTAIVRMLNMISDTPETYIKVLTNYLGIGLNFIDIPQVSLPTVQPDSQPEIEVTAEMKNYITALKTKPFLLLAGISGTGKSQKVKELAYMTCPNTAGLRNDATTPGNYCIIEVKPNWHDSTELLGYYSNLSGKYDITPFIHFAYKAIQHPDVPFFVCLDEMNLAPVEQYFAEYLSVLETRTKQADGKIVTAELLKKEIFDRCELTKGEEHLYKTAEEEEIITYLKNNGLRLPENLFVVGTVNMDDTTHQFSRKVIDRAFTIEMNGEDLTSMFDEESVKALEYCNNPLSLDALKPEFVKANEVLKDARFAQYVNDIQTKVPSILNDINTVLKNTPFRVSYRVQNEFILYMSSMILAGMEDVNAAVKNTALVILLEKILPRVQGDNKLLATAGNSNVLKDLRNLVEEKLSGKDVASDVHDEVIAKLDEMNLKLENSYFANFF